jgi:hypothetical protein
VFVDAIAAADGVRGGSSCRYYGVAAEGDYVSFC